MYYDYLLFGRLMTYLCITVSFFKFSSVGGEWGVMTTT